MTGMLLGALLRLFFVSEVVRYWCHWHLLTYWCKDTCGGIGIYWTITSVDLITYITNSVKFCQLLDLIKSWSLTNSVDIILCRVVLILFTWLYCIHLLYNVYGYGFIYIYSWNSMLSRFLGNPYGMRLSQYWCSIQPSKDSSEIRIFDETVDFFLGS